MKSSAKQREEVKIECPRLVQYMPTGLIILETKHKTGFVVHHGSDCYTIGHYRNDWCTETNSWQPYNGSVVLEN